MTYPECDAYDCPECPRAPECIDRDIDELSIEPTAEDSFIEYIDQRFNDIERRLYALEKFKDAVERLVSKATQAYENEEER